MTALPSLPTLLARAGAVLATDLRSLDAYHYAPLEDPRDIAITRLLEGYRTLSSVALRERLAASLTPWQLGTFSSYFTRMAMIAVRAKSIEALTLAAVALALSEYQGDARERQMDLALLARAVELVGGNLSPYWAAAAAAPDDELSIVFRTAAQLWAPIGSLGVMIVREISGPNGIVWISPGRQIPSGW